MIENTFRNYLIGVRTSVRFYELAEAIVLWKNLPYLNSQETLKLNFSFKILTKFLKY